MTAYEKRRLDVMNFVLKLKDLHTDDQIMRMMFDLGFYSPGTTKKDALRTIVKIRATGEQMRETLLAKYRNEETA